VENEYKISFPSRFSTKRHLLLSPDFSIPSLHSLITLITFGRSNHFNPQNIEFKMHTSTIILLALGVASQASTIPAASKCHFALSSFQPSNSSNISSSPAGKTGQAAADAFNSAITGAAKLAVGSSGLDFGKCTPTMDFQAGRAGRKATEFTFQATDSLIATGQQDALNPAIIVNRICDQLTNVCGAAADAKAACLTAKTAPNPAKKNLAKADTFNAALGF
jgi:hypothetical protein